MMFSEQNPAWERLGSRLNLTVRAVQPCPCKDGVLVTGVLVTEVFSVQGWGIGDRGIGEDWVLVTEVFSVRGWEAEVRQRLADGNHLQK
jgi:hypothetical protein